VEIEAASEEQASSSQLERNLNLSNSDVKPGNLSAQQYELLAFTSLTEIALQELPYR
jgi:hypothetical protein